MSPSFFKARRRRRRREGAAIWYHPEQSELGIGGPNDRFGGVEPRRGDAVAAALVRDRLVEAASLRRPEQVSLSDLARFHTWRYLDACTRAETLARIFGVQPEHIDPEKVLRSARLGVGATVEAAQEVAAGRAQVAVHLGGGFHHAEPDRGSGFCVFNDIGVAIRKLRADGDPDPIAIVDLDVHQGNGHSAAFSAGEGVRVYSIHGSIWSHADQPLHREIYLEGRVSDRRYIACLRTTLEPWLKEIEPGLIFYVAGADVLLDDALGDFDLSLSGAFERDRLVFELAKELGAGLVVTMGGGYSKAAWLQFANLARYALSGSTRIVRSVDQRLRESFDRVSAELDPFELQADPTEIDFGMTPEELFGQLQPSPEPHRLLDFYSQAGIQVALERYGISEAIRERGFQHIEVSIDVSDPNRQILRVTGERHGARHLLVELVLGQTQLDIGGEARLVLFVEWLLLQDPTRSFSLSRPPLPGQEHPGLGLSSHFVFLLLKVCERLGLDAIASRPSRFHNAAGAAGTFFFVDPSLQGRFEAMRSALAGVSVGEASKIIEAGRLRTEDGEVVGWEPGLFVVPAGEKSLRSEAYEEERRAARKELQARGLQITSSTSSIPSST